jgi:defect in organelle trafficking protein DotB
VINQRLARSIDGRRTALREYVAFDSRLRSQFLRTDPTEWPALTRRAVDEQGQSYAVAIGRALAEGRISEQVATHERRNIG